MSGLKAIRTIAWAAVVLLAVATGWLLFAGRNAPDSGATGIVAASIGGPFSVVDQHGAPVTEASLKGHPSAMFFGYTFCPDVCPTTLADMTLWMQELGASADKFKVYFVTVDPERDTPAQMAEYLTAFDPRIVGLTGDRASIDQMLQAFRAYSRKTGDGEYYLMDHTASVYLLDENGQFVGTVDYKEKPETALAKLKRLVGT